MQIEEPSQRTNIFGFKKLKIPDNSLVNKNLPSIKIDVIDSTIECKDSDGEPTVTRAQNPLSLDNCVSYFQVEVLGVTEEDAINIGLMARDSNTKQFLGKMNNSIGFMKGEIHINKKKVTLGSQFEKLKVGDLIGIGINCEERQFFFVKNGLVFKNRIEIPLGWNQFYPAVGLSNQGEKIKFRFGLNEFCFNLLDLTVKTQEQIESKIKKEEVPKHQIYSLVQEYLVFKGHSKTLQLLNQKKIEFQRLPKLTKNPAITVPSIILQNNPALSKQKIDEDEQMNEPLKLRNRIMSERLPAAGEEQQILEARRKNTEMMIEENDESMIPHRKCSLVSNLSNYPMYPQSEEKQCFFCEEEQKEMQMPVNEGERFLLNQRLQIVQLIRQKKIEEAQAILQKFIPKIFDEQYLMTYLYGHIFLRKIKQQSINDAIIFSKKQRQCFENHMSTMFPFYCSKTKGLKWEPFKHIFTSLAAIVNRKKGNSEQVDILSDKQFEYFSIFMNSLILKQMGYLGCSRLGYMINNIKKMQEKLRDYKGMNCGVELKV